MDVTYIYEMMTYDLGIYYVYLCVQIIGFFGTQSHIFAKKYYVMKCIACLINSYLPTNIINVKVTPSVRTYVTLSCLNLNQRTKFGIQG